MAVPILFGNLFLFIQIFVVGFIVSLIKCKEPNYDEMDSEDSDEEQLITA